MNFIINSRPPNRNKFFEMVHPAAFAISLGVVLGGAIFALFFYNNRNQDNQWRYEERPRRDPLEFMQHQFESYVNFSINIFIARYRVTVKKLIYFFIAGIFVQFAWIDSMMTMYFWSVVTVFISDASKKV